ncbi:MAG: glycosyltransferase family 2 protein [Fibrobacterota bacterium]
MLFILILSAFFLSAYLLYPLVIYFASSLKEEPLFPPLSGEFPMVTILVPVVEGFSGINEKIKNFREINYPSDRLFLKIGIDERPGTFFQITQINECLTNIEIKRCGLKAGKTNVLRMLLNNTRSGLVLFTDCNSRLEPGAVREMVRCMSLPSTGAASAALKLIDRGNNINPESIYWGFEEKLKSLESKVFSMTGATGAAYMMRKEDINIPDSERLYADDYVIPSDIFKKGMRIRYCRNAVVHEPAESHTDDFFKRRLRISEGNFNSLFFLLPNMYRSRILFMFIFHKVARWITPFAAVASLPGFFCFIFTTGGYKGLAAVFVLSIFFIGAFLLRLRPARLAAHFLSANAAVIGGAFISLTGRKKSWW